MKIIANVKFGVNVNDANGAMIQLRAPLARAMTTLDRSLFSKTFQLAAASIKDNRNISKYRTQLIKEKRVFDRINVDPLRAHPDESAAGKGRKCLLLTPDVKFDSTSTWGPTLEEGTKADELEIIPYDLTLGYDKWTYHEIMESILPEELQGEVPSGFNTVGDVVHLNLRDQFLPYKKVIADLIIDKSPRFRTVINKIDNVGTESAYRTFSYEVLAGPDDLNVEVKENDCIFKFDYAKVYWNSKLEPEHTRLVRKFQPGEVVCDLMAGIGPFAVPAGRKGVFVYANDMNPESYKRQISEIPLQQTANTEPNQVDQFVRPFNEDGLTFIHKAADLVREASEAGSHALVRPRHKFSRSNPTPAPEPVRVPVPPTISHFVMNLPGSATTFLHRFRGVYAGREALFAPHTATKLPVVHVHCFAQKASDEGARSDIVERIYEQIGVRLPVGENLDAGEVDIYDVRDVAPNKRMFCASFRVPPEVAFAPRG
ncbi:probable protein MET-10 [Cephalotrichum gorgonifer]|uniref:tRNA (guanine(37)-N1)-methyltransferase n=1 Tax=Cephalotrichum gorgonifer TaxID=2041049 RepID=A0AAE8MP52_9PEZI|nr:probable protein MET-10 [Cephalotrichum gorgonifer]